MDANKNDLNTYKINFNKNEWKGLYENLSHCCKIIEPNFYLISILTY